MNWQDREVALLKLLRNKVQSYMNTASQDLLYAEYGTSTFSKIEGKIEAYYNVRKLIDGCIAEFEKED
jgi:hypothetical protein